MSKEYYPYTCLKKPCSSSRHMLSKLVGEPLANNSGRFDTITCVAINISVRYGLCLS